MLECYHFTTREVISPTLTRLRVPAPSSSTIHGWLVLRPTTAAASKDLHCKHRRNISKSFPILWLIFNVWIGRQRAVFTLTCTGAVRWRRRSTGSRRNSTTARGRTPSYRPTTPLTTRHICVKTLASTRRWSGTTMTRMTVLCTAGDACTTVRIRPSSLL